ncbi:hypothetical protein SAMN06265222_1532 [Neorhodopirellula lusitana]|uniref:Uncharacterized protein n=1 Tax=Neorhodopirellula lusitana TaxID=445327 RepID=A0ABY1QUF3_9BACT|nr:hypothetical protein SAMN06265222_1532 [Neorhodopirellula lusitana]
MTCTGGRLVALLEWDINRPSPVMSNVIRLNRISMLVTNA